MNTLEEIAGVLKRTESAVIFTHMRPDGDTLGCAMALHRALSILNKKSEVVCESEIPVNLLFLEGMGEIRKAPSFSPDVYIAVDASAPSRLGALERVFTAGMRKRVTVNIDHHVSNTRFAKYNFVQNRASNCENIMDLISLLGIEVDGALAQYLMLGIVTDSGCFSRSSVDAATFRMAAELAEKGADVGRISYEALKRQSKARAQLFAETVSRLRYLLEDRLAIAYVSQEMLKKYALPTQATEGIVDFALTIDSVEVSVSLLEAKRGQYKASFRSKGKVDVNRIAGAFGGGGHVAAAGCMFFGDIEEVYDKIRYAVWQNLEE